MKIDTAVSYDTNYPQTRSSDVVRALCRRVKQLEEAGEFETAREELAAFWPLTGDRPELEGLDESVKGEVLLRAGALSGWLGSAKQIAGAQEAAKDLISESGAVFEKLGLVEKCAEAQIELAICYWRAGSLDEARITFDDALARLGNLESEQRLRALLNKAIVEKVSTRYSDALLIHTEAAPLFERSQNHALKGKFHNEYATVLKNLGLASGSEAYIDQALVEYAAASFHFEEAGHKRFLPAVENNLGFLYVHLGHFADAHDHLDRARSLFRVFNDMGMIGQVDDTKARAYLGQGLNERAEAVASGAVRILEKGDEVSLLTAALTTHGVALARLGQPLRARQVFERAVNAAQMAGDREGGGLAALSLVEELQNDLLVPELLSYYRTAHSFLVTSQHMGVSVRLGQAASRLLTDSRFTVPATTAPNGHSQTQEEQEWVGCALDAEVLRHEGELIRRALEVSKGSVTRAARMLGLTHQGLAFILNGRQKDLLPARTPVKRRRRSIIRYRK